MGARQARTPQAPGGRRQCRRAKTSAHACGVATEIDHGELWCWGENSAGQILPASGAHVYDRLDSHLNPFVYAVGSQFTCYAGVDFETRTNPISQCRGVDIASLSGFPQIRDYPSVFGAVAMEAGGISACALFTGGDLRCWGRNFAGQLGNGEVTQEPVPVPVVPTGDHNWTAVDLGEYNTCGIAESITYCWGDNTNGTLGDGTEDNRSVPTAVVGQL